MTELKGLHNTAILFTDTADAATVQQIQHLLDQDFIAGSKIRIMPDAHAGMGCTIGTTMTVTDKVVPNLVGVDIGCGMETGILEAGGWRVELDQLDKAIHKHIPAGFRTRQTPHRYADETAITELRCAKHVDLNRAELSVGTLGGGNHFIELGKDDEGTLYLVVHSGSRNLGKQVCEHYQNMAADMLGRKGKGMDRVLAYLEGEPLKDYLHDMRITQEYADINRKAIVKELEKHLKLKIRDQFTTIHNYIDLDTNILRKGAVSAAAGERLLIPMNMRDGSLLCVGKGNADWNFSAPHGAGRLMSRTEAKNSITLNSFKSSMAGIHSSTVNASTLDEAPQAYKPMGEITRHIGPTADVVKVIKPIYNFKSME
jgi:RNA-splicing ligase RtcB